MANDGKFNIDKVFAVGEIYVYKIERKAILLKGARCFYR